jgi:long-chain-fatty-acid--[acyl-carrier-protein] ligase
MRLLYYWTLYWILRGLISLRYKIEVKGGEALSQAHRSGALILPNHPAEIDPLILIMVLWPKLRPRPLVVEHFYYQKMLRYFMDLVKTVPIPTTDTLSPWKIKQIAKIKQQILAGLAKGDNFLIYPSGRLKTTADERIGGASMIHDLLQQTPADQPLLLVLTKGLWGSHFSRGLNGKTPDFTKVALEGFKTLLKNGLFFAPRRKVLVELQWAGAEFPRKGSRQQVNEALEKWYNKEGEEPLQLVSSAFWKEELPEVTRQEKKEGNHQIPPEVEGEVLSHLSKLAHRSKESLKPELSLSSDLGLDSLDLAQLYFFIEERYKISGLMLGQLETVQDLLEAAAGKIKEAEGPLPPQKRPRWPVEKKRGKIEMPEGNTLQEVFLQSCKKRAGFIACADRMTPPLSYDKFKRAAVVLSLKIKELEGEHIGILLPASVAAYVTVFATLLAGKIPVMLNWTVGAKSLEHSVYLGKVQTIISSYRFLSRLNTVDLGSADERLCLLEEMRHEIPLWMKLQGAALALLPSSAFLKRCVADPNQTALIIFTSGTETLPKGVPLTHNNLLANQRAALACIEMQPDDILHAVLPPFHSFGLSVTGILPLLIGLKVCYGPDPTDSRTIGADIAHWRATLFCAAPSFIQPLLKESSGLESLRLTVTGAEKAPEEMFKAFKALRKELIEGYGISECSPIVTLQRKGEYGQGVGRPLPEIEIQIREEEIWIAGPNVFPGYLGDVPNPFTEEGGKRWYHSGDRGYLQEGILYLTGRLKRFVKMGGEMISLGGIEEDLLKLAPKSDKPLLAVTARGRESEKPEIIVFAAFDLTREQAAQFLKEKGYGPLVKIAEVRRIDAIPLTGTGKTQYRLLDEMVAQQKST